MPQKARIDDHGALHHIIVRGIERRKIFLDDFGIIFYKFERLIKRVAKLFEISPKELLSGGEHTIKVKARSVVCYWGNRELGMSTIELSKKMNISQPTASQSMVRGQKIAREEKLAFLELRNQ